MKEVRNLAMPFGDYGVETQVPVYEYPEGHHPIAISLPVKRSQLEFVADIDNMRQPLIIRVDNTALQVTKNQRTQTIQSSEYPLPYTGLYEMPNALDELYVTNLDNGSNAHSTTPQRPVNTSLEDRKNMIHVNRDWYDRNQIFQKGNLHISDSAVSRRHAIIGLTGRGMLIGVGKIFALDLASTNGTSVVVHEIDADKVAVTNPFEENPFK